MTAYQPRHNLDPVWFNGLQLNDLTALGSSGGVWIEGIQGWDERPDVRDVRESRPGQHGEYADNLYLGGRTITISGKVIGTTWEDLQTKKRALAAKLVPSSTEALFKVPLHTTASPATSYSTTGMSGYERVSARVVEPISFGDPEGFTAAFQVSLRASDPRVYSDTESTTTSAETSSTSTRTATVDQGGSVSTPATITMNGSATAPWSLTSAAGLALFFPTRSLVAGEAIQVNTQDRTVNLAYSSYVNHRIAQSDILAIWPLNETSGTTADNAQGTATYDGTYSGTYYTLNQSGFSSGTKSVYFSGSTGKVEVAYSAALNTSATTCECWINPAAVPVSTRVIVDTYNSGTFKGFRIVVNNGALHFTFGDGVAGYTLATSLQSVGTWAQVHAVVTSYDARLYVNGDLKAVRNDKAYSANTTETFRIGTKTFNSFDGYISCVALYNTARTSQQIEALVHSDPDAPTELAYQHVSATGSNWVDLPPESTLVSYASAGMTASGSTMSVKYRDARL